MIKHNACVATQHGWVDIDTGNSRSVNCVTEHLHEYIFNTRFYKDKENIWWPTVKRIDNYESSFGKALSYYETDYIHHIVHYPEFTSQQFKDALLFLINICQYCEKHSYYLRTHLWNVTFKNGHPFLIDVRDFEINKGQWWAVIFQGHFRDTLDSHCPIHASEFVSNYKDIKQRLDNTTNSLDDIKHIIEDIEVICKKDATWTNYHHERTEFLKKDYMNTDMYNKIKNYTGGGSSSDKSLVLFNFIEDIKPKTIIEIGCNNGLYCFGASQHSNVIGVDYDANAINEATQINSRLKQSCTFLCMDILEDDTISYGLYGDKYTRFKSEMLIAPAVMHHLYNKCKSLDTIISRFDKLATKYMIIEHINDIYDGNKFKETLVKYGWEITNTEYSSPKPRTWYMCKRSTLNLDIDECKLFELFSKQLPSKGTFIEIGSRDGKDHSLTLQKNNWNGYCIEANPEIAQVLHSNFKHNPNIKTFNYAITRNNGMIDFHIESTPNSGVSSIHENRANSSDSLNISRVIKYKVTVEGKTLNTFVDEEQIYDCDFLLTDCEGEDINILLSTNFDTFKPKFIMAETSFPYYTELGVPTKNRVEKSVLVLSKLMTHMKTYNYKLIFSNNMKGYKQTYCPDLMDFPMNCIWKLDD